MTSTVNRPPTLPGSPTPEQQPSSNPNRRRISGRAIGAAMGGVAAVGLAAALVFMPKGESAPPVLPDGEPDGTEQVDNPTAGEYMVDLEDLSKMSPEQITALATISVESVTGADGNINWQLYAEKLNDTMLLGTMAGTTTAEVEEAYINASSADMITTDAYQYIATNYDEAFTDGFAVEGLELGGYKETHLALIGAAYTGYLIDKGPVERTLELVGPVEIVSATDSGATLILTRRTTDNFFSSGIYQANDPKDVEALGRSTDVDLTYKTELTTIITDGNIYLQSINP